MTLLILACALPAYNLWWPFFVVLFYLLAPIPTLIAKRLTQDSSDRAGIDLGIFLTMGILISAFGLPIVLARTGTILWGACYLTVCGNFVVFLTLLGFFLSTEDLGDGYYSGSW